ncbi:hypothetical protein EVAR_80139_1 [Eumeta japonica]|uniref:Uncharacterized protein n=1 Tax=Eumeta variegata TaxID=151549 RepID=A0A4C1YJ71_EUMVA|nr:hypothetical protein EVAR_80139_1 [Eumeta japonica]
MINSSIFYVVDLDVNSNPDPGPAFKSNSDPVSEVDPPMRIGHLLVHSQSSDDEQRQYAKSQVCTVLRREFHRARKPAPLNRFSSTVSRAMMSSANTPSLKSVPLFVKEFHRARKPAPLNRFIVHGQSSDDSSARTPSLKSVPFFVEEFPCAETSAAAPFARPRRAMISSASTLSLKSVPFFVEEFHMRETSAAAPFSRSRSVER